MCFVKIIINLSIINQFFCCFSVLSSINCNDNNTESSVANLSVSLSPMMDGMLEELKYTIDLSENETNVNRTEEETNVSINITEPESEFYFIYELYCVMFSLLFHFNFVTNLYYNILILGACLYDRL